MTTISVSGLVKRFGRTRALDGLELSVRTGEVHGFLGPNGAGKSTTLRVLLGLLRVDAGQVRLLDGDPWRDAVALHRRLAYVPGDVTLWPNLTGGEVIDLLGPLRAGMIARFALDPAHGLEHATIAVLLEDGMPVLHGFTDGRMIATRSQIASTSSRQVARQK